MVNFSSWKNTKWGGAYNEISFFIKSYEELLDRIEVSRKNKPTLVLTYEKLTENGVNYLNQVCDGIIDIPENLTLIKSSYRFGDERGKESTNIDAARMNYDNLTPNEIDNCKKLLIPYTKI